MPAGRAKASLRGAAAALVSLARSSAAPSSGDVVAASGSAPGGQPSRPSTDGTDAVGRCSTDDLSLAVQPEGPAAGQRYATIVLTDVSERRCTVHGYGGLQLTGPDGAALATQQVRVPGRAAPTVTLDPGSSARAHLHWSVVAAPDDVQSGACQPSPAALA